MDIIKALISGDKHAPSKGLSKTLMSKSYGIL